MSEVIQRHRLPIRDGGTYEFEGRLLGSASSESPEKSRWFEIAIYITTDGLLLLHTAGKTRRAGETPRYRLIETRSAFELVDRMIVAHPDRYDRSKPDLVYIPNPSLRALTTAAQWNDDLLEALREVPTMIAVRQAGSSRG